VVKDLIRPAHSGHFDELQGRLASTGRPVQLAAVWQSFFDHLGTSRAEDLSRRNQILNRQVRDNGITYNVYANPNSPQRPWAVDLFPLILTPQSWQQIEAGVIQRARLLESLMVDVYGDQKLIRQALIPAALVQGHPGYLRAMHGITPAGGNHLHIAAFDLARGPEGQWSVVSQRTQAPSGLGYLLENRLLISQQFPQAFEALHIQRLAASYRHWMTSLKQHSRAGDNAHVALLTPGPYNETYFEHAYLARYLGLSLVEGGDLTVRDERLYLRTLRGLEPVHVLIKRMDDEFLDPLELRADSTLGIPGLLQAIRAGNVVVANTPGSAFLESPALLGFLPALSKALLNEELSLPALDTWWCGEAAAMTSALTHLEHTVIKPTYPQSQFSAALGFDLTPSQRDEWAGRISRHPDAHCLQAYTPLAQMPTWLEDAQAVVPRTFMLRVFALRDGANSWRVLPGGLARIAPANAQIASMQSGGSSADVWVQTHAPVDRTTLLTKTTQASQWSPRKRIVTSRAAENLYWLGRYSERCENTVRWVKLCLETLNNQEPVSDMTWDWMHQLSQTQGLIPPNVPRRMLERTMLASLDQDAQTTSVGYNLRCLQQAASSLRDRLSSEQWGVIERCVERFNQECQHMLSHPEFSAVQAIQTLEATSSSLAAITGAQTDRMTRDDGWQLLSIGRHIERLAFLSECLTLSVTLGALDEPIHNSHFTALLAVFDSTITFNAQFQQHRELPPLLSLLVLDPDNPRSLAWVTRALRARLSKLADTPIGEPDALALQVPKFELDLQTLCSRDTNKQLSHLQTTLAQCTQAAWQVSDAVTARYFSHTLDADSIGI
jgi:uncharacterized circularly permuted ATP-grasp superfamily protein/uncharacterized alpha-E superfamily protein